ncbi:MAG: ABC transporter permease [Bacteroidales bacterium]|nr:ABC transporter permease [Bacteroidales bacterium]
MLHKLLHSIGDYLLLMYRVFSRPQRSHIFWHQYLKEFYSLGYSSLGIVILMSLFIGALLCVQIKLNVWSPWMPRFTIGYAMREVMLLEFASSIICIILAGKVGSNIASEIGTMRVTQQIDALDVMGVNSANYIILPKILALVSAVPLFVTFSIASGIGGAYLVCSFSDLLPLEDLTIGLQHSYEGWHLWTGYIKSFFFAFIIASVSSYFGYMVTGGSIEVGRASTNAVVVSSVLILFSDLLLTNLLMG